MAAAEVMDGAAVRRWCRLAARALAQARSGIDALNVFPVPDADTGSNLHRTLVSAAEAVEALPPGADPAAVWQAAAHGAMLGACGNSGIIVSQLLRGLADVCGSASPCDGPAVAAAFGHAAALARAAVSRPVEGTVLTVADAAARAAGARAAGARAAEARAAGARAAEARGADEAAPAASLHSVVLAAASAGRRALDGTTSQLRTLASAGVVDAGAAGLCVLLDAWCAAISGEIPPTWEVPAASPAAGAAQRQSVTAGSFGYEVTYLLAAPAPAVADLREQLDSLGDSLVIVGGGELWSVHVHVADAGAAIEAALRAGRPRRLTVSYLGAAAAAGHGVLVICEGDGVADLIESAGAAVLRSGPAGELPVTVLSAAIRQTGRRCVVIPDSGSAAAAAAAAEQLRDEGIEVMVMDVRSPVQALAAVAVHDPDGEFGANAAAMNRAAARVRYGSVAGSGDGGVLGMIGDAQALSGTDQGAVAAAVAAAVVSAGTELVTLIEGPAARPGLAQLVAEQLRSAVPAAEIACYGGGPAAAHLLIGAE